MSDPQFKIGDTAYLATSGTQQIWIECPECLGTGRFQVILATGENLSIECHCCERGYDGSPGKISGYEFCTKVEKVRISGVETNQWHEGAGLETRYRVESGWSPDADTIFATEEEAQARSVELLAKNNAEQEKRIRSKEKDAKSWKWHVSYHKREIRRAQKDLDYHTAKLNVASKKAEENDEPK